MSKRSKLKKKRFNESFTEQCFKNHNDPVDFEDRMSVSSGSSVLDEDYYKNQLSPIPKHVILNNRTRIHGNLTPTKSDFEKKFNQNNANLISDDRRNSTQLNRRSRSLNKNGNENKPTVLPENVNQNYINQKNQSTADSKKFSFDQDKSHKSSDVNKSCANIQPINQIAQTLINQNVKSQRFDEFNINNSRNHQIQSTETAKVVETVSNQNHLRNRPRNVQKIESEVVPSVSNLNVNRRESREFEENYSRNRQRSFQSAQVVPRISNQREPVYSNFNPIQQVPSAYTNTILPHNYNNLSNEIAYNRLRNVSSTEAIVNDNENDNLCCCVIL